MDRFRVIVFLLALMFSPVIAVHAEDAAPAQTQPTADAPAQAAKPAAPEQPAGENLPALENLDFASGEILTFDAPSGKIDVKVYLDANGEANEQTLSLKADNQTEITDGENELKTDALVKGAEVDVEYDTRTKAATYIFVY